MLERKTMVWKHRNKLTVLDERILLLPLALHPWVGLGFLNETINFLN